MLFCLLSGLGDAVDFMDDEAKKRRIARRNMELFLEYLGFEPQFK